jgi:hypothetical protein
MSLGKNIRERRGRGRNAFSGRESEYRPRFNGGSLRNCSRFGSTFPVKLLPFQLGSETIAVDKFIGFQVVFGEPGLVPPGQEILVERDIKACVIPVVLEKEFGHRLHIKTGMIMLDPEIIAEDGQLE